MNEHPLLTLIIIVAPLSLLAIGGASAIYGPLQHQVVDVHALVSGRDYLELFAIARVTPGPGSMLTTIIGWRVAGLSGALVATLALYLPCSALCFAAARTWTRFRGTSWHTAVEEGLRPIAAGLMISGGIAIMRVEGASLIAWLMALGTMAVLFWRPLLHPIWLLAGGAAVFVLVRAALG